jgi:hypothetical protein
MNDNEYCMNDNERINVHYSLEFKLLLYKLSCETDNMFWIYMNVCLRGQVSKILMKRFSI